MSPETVRLARAITMAALLTLLAIPAAAQTAQTPPGPTVAPLRSAPLPWLVVDARAGMPSLGPDTTTAAALGVEAADLASRGRALTLGAHVYPLRRGTFKLGVGAEMQRATVSNQRKDADGKPVGPVINRQINGVSTQVSLNFGKGRGWSYITVGGGPMKFESWLDDVTPTTVGTTTLNWGGGARWFTRAHLAFTLDLRFYLTRPAVTTALAAGRNRQRVTLLSAGISVK